MKVVALSAGARTPSSRFRIRQYVPVLGRFGIDVRDYPTALPQQFQLPAPFDRIRRRYYFPLTIGQAVVNLATRTPGTLASYRADATWISRSFLPGMESLVRLVKGPRVLDVDDAIWLSTPFGVKAAAAFARRMDAIIVGNSFLADWYSKYCALVTVVPDPIDIDRYTPLSKERKDAFVIGWIGTASNFHELYRIESALDTFIRHHPESRIRIVSNKPPQFSMLPASSVDYVRWSAEIEVSEIQKFDVGIMPLADSEWARGKNSNKMLCYMACGLPVVVSPTGTNAEVLALGDIGYAAQSSEEWVDALTCIWKDSELALRQGRVGRLVVEKEFDRDILGEKIGNIFKRFR